MLLSRHIIILSLPLPRMNQKISILVFAFLIFFSQGKAQETWSIQKCIEYALANNISVKQNMLNADLAKENYNQSIANIMP